MIISGTCHRERQVTIQPRKKSAHHSSVLTSWWAFLIFSQSSKLLRFPWSITFKSWELMDDLKCYGPFVRRLSCSSIDFSLRWCSQRTRKFPSFSCDYYCTVLKWEKRGDWIWEVTHVFFFFVWGTCNSMKSPIYVQCIRVMKPLQNRYAAVFRVNTFQKDLVLFNQEVRTLY